MASGISFREKLAKYCEGTFLLDSVTQYDPTLTILVPYIDSTMNAESWDVNDSYSPIVALRKTDISMKETKLPFYDSHANTGAIERFGKPEKFVLIVKSNERLISSDDVSTRSTSLLGNELQNENGLFAYFSDKEFNNYSNKAATKATNSKFKNTIERQRKSFYAYFRQLDVHRDYVYYSIDPKVNNKGKLDNSYAEHLTEINFNSSASYNIVVKSSDISEGALEFHIDLIFSRKSEKALNLRVVLHIPISDMFFQDYKSPRIYTLPQPKELFTWDFFEYGDTYKISISEYDNGAQTTNTHSITSTFGTNMEKSSSIEGEIIKVGNKHGNSMSHTFTSTTTTILTENSVLLGEFFVNFFDPIYTDIGIHQFFPRKRTLKYKPNVEDEKRFNTFDSIDWMFTSGITGNKSYNTGTMSVTILPMKKK